MPVTSGIIIRGAYEYPSGLTTVVRVAAVPSSGDEYASLLRGLTSGKSSNRVPQLIRARVYYYAALTSYEPWPNAPKYCPVVIDLVGVEWTGKEYLAARIPLSLDKNVARGVVDVTEHYRLPPLLLTPWRLEIGVDCRKAVLGLYIALYVEWGW